MPLGRGSCSARAFPGLPRQTRAHFDVNLRLGQIERKARAERNGDPCYLHLGQRDEGLHYPLHGVFEAVRYAPPPSAAWEFLPDQHRGFADGSQLNCELRCLTRHRLRAASDGVLHADRLGQRLLHRGPHADDAVEVLLSDAAGMPGGARVRQFRYALVPEAEHLL